MGCGCGKNKPEPINNGVIKNMLEAGSKQINKVQWFKDGITGIIKCIEGKTLYSDEDIKINRDTCRKCEFSSKNSDGKLSLSSQCMRPIPEKDGAPCGCFLTCKTQVGPHCEFWPTTPLTINNT